MILNKPGSMFECGGTIYCIGDEIIGTSESEYEGLRGSIYEIRTGVDQETENDTPDIYCSFEVPTLSEDIKKLEAYFSELYGEEKTIDDITLDCVIMAPSMICHSHSPTSTSLTKKSFMEDCVNGIAKAEDIDEYVEYWHNHITGRTLKDFLGFTDAEYVKYSLHSDDIIHSFIEARRNNIKEGGRNMTTQEKYLKELDTLLEDCSSLDYYTSPSFQCDESGGFPVSLCVHWGKGKAWLEPKSNLSEEDSTLVKKVMDGIADFGIRDCTNEEEYNNILKALGDDAYQNAQLIIEDNGDMQICQS